MADLSMTPDDVDAAVRTVIGEDPAAAPQVAAVIRNRALSTGASISDVVHAPGQFEAWSRQGDKLHQIDPSSPAYQRTLAQIAPVLRGDQLADFKADSFYSPKAQAALGRQPPPWDDGTGQTFGQSKFFTVGPKASGGYGLDGSGKAVPAPPPYAANTIGHVPGGVPTAPVPPSPQEFAERNGLDLPQPVAPTPEEFAKRNGIKLGPTASAAPPESPKLSAARKDFRVPPEDALGAALDSWSLHGAPAVAGAEAALYTGGRNLLAGAGIGQKAPYGMGEAYQAGSDAEQGALDAYARQHPIENAGANVAGFAASGPAHALAEGAENLAVRAAPKLATSVAGRVATRALGTAAAAGTAGTNAGVAEGQSIPGALATGGEEALLSVPFGLAGEGVASAASRLGGRITPRVVGPAAAAALGAAYGSSDLPGSPHSPVTGAITGAALGLGARGKAEPVVEPTPVENARALDILANRTGGDRTTAAPHTTVADNLDQADDNMTTAEALGRRGQGVATMAVKGYKGDTTPIHEAIDARQQPGTVLDRVTNGVADITGANPATAKTDVASQIEAEQEGLRRYVADSPGRVTASIRDATGVDPETAKGDVADAVAREQEGLHQRLAESPDRVMTEVRNATGVDPVTAQMDVRDQIDAAREGPAREAYARAITGKGVWTPELSNLASEPPVRTAMGQAASMLGQRAFVDNPEAPARGAAQPPLRMTAQELRAAVQERALKPGQDVSTSDLMDYLRKGPNAAYEVAPKTPAQVPTDEMWEMTKRILDKRSRNLNDPGEAFVAGEWSRRMRDATNTAIPGLTEARAISGEYLSSQKAYDAATELGSAGKDAETADAFERRWAKMTPGEQAATQHGYMAKMYRAVESGRFQPEAYQTPFHDRVQRQMFGEEPARSLRTTLARESLLKDRISSGGLLKEAADVGAQAWKPGASSDQITKRYASMSPPEKETAKRSYLGELSARVEAGRLSPDALSTPLHTEVTKAMFGDEGAGRISELLARERVARERLGEGGLLKQAADLGRSPWTSGASSRTADQFTKRYATMSGPEQETAKRAYLGELHSRVEAGKFDPSALESPLHAAVTKTMFGDAGVTGLRDLFAREKRYEASAKTFAKAATPKPETKSEGADVPFMAALGGTEHGLHGAFRGLESATVARAIPRLQKAASDAYVTPGTREALRRLLAQGPKETARQLRLRQAERRQPSERPIVRHAVRTAALGVADNRRGALNAYLASGSGAGPP